MNEAQYREYLQQIIDDLCKVRDGFSSVPGWDTNLSARIWDINLRLAIEPDMTTEEGIQVIRDILGWITDTHFDKGKQ